MRVTDKYVYFWGEWPSNFASAEFVTRFNGKEYNFYNSEQYFMFVKAMTFGDEKIAAQILKEGIDPKRAKSLGRKVSNFNDEKWSKIRYKVMVKANMCKYTQNEHLKKYLLNPEYDGKHFVEASNFDIVWGIGVNEYDAKDDQSNWLGQNLLGKCLDDVRERIKNGETDGKKNVE